MFISKDKEITWEVFESTHRGKKHVIRDREDESIHYESKQALAAGLSLRALMCPMHNCGG